MKFLLETSVKLDKYQFVASFISLDNEKYQITFQERVNVDTILRLNSHYHTIQKIDDTFKISIKQDYFNKDSPEILELFLSDKYETEVGQQISVYKDSNTLEVFKIVEKADTFKLNSIRLLKLKNMKLIIIKEAHTFNGNYVIENWIHHLDKKI
jgi:hypothetical protein